MKVVMKDLTKIFPSRSGHTKSTVTAVDHVSFEVPDGKLVGLLGPSGCGKSTMLYLICGLEKPTCGEIYFGDENVTEVPAERRGIGLVFQNYALYPHLTVLDNIIFPLKNLKGKDKLSKEEMVNKAKEVAKLVQIENLLERKPSEMSGGQQQRVAIARALVKMPKVLLLDEPLSNLDARLRLQTREEIRRIQQQTGITTVFVTHDQEEAMSISDYIVVMKEGAIHQIGEPQKVYDDPVNLFVAKFLGNPQINVLDGKIRGGSLYIADAEIMKTGYDRDTDVKVGIRPEGFIPRADGPLECDVKRIETIGRDISVLSSHPASEADTIRSIIDDDDEIDIRSRTIRYVLKPNKVFIFDASTGDRIRI